jgi:hypothetical protein
MRELFWSIGQDNRKKREVYGFDGGKRVKGRKRHILVDSLGLLLKVVVTEANASERVVAAYALMLLLEEHADVKRKSESAVGRRWISRRPFCLGGVADDAGSGRSDPATGIWI